jgi:hypothetical protein
MERTDKAVVIPVDFAWNDVGAWSELWQASDRDAHGNVVSGDVKAMGTQNSYLRSEGPLIATVGINDMIVIATADAVLVARKGADQEVKALVAVLQADDHPAAASSPLVHRPWGHFPDHRAGRALSGEAHHGQSRRQAVAAEAHSQGRALGRRQRHGNGHP